MAVAVAVPEAGVTGLPQTSSGSVIGDGLSAVQDEISGADVVLVGPGLDDPGLTATLVRALIPLLDPKTRLVVDAYALGVLADLEDVIEPVHGRLVLTPNHQEASRLLEREVTDDADDSRAIAARYGAVVTLKGVVADPEGRTWQIGTGHGGPGTSGSGDVLAGAVAGLLARGSAVDQAARWAAHLHAAAGDRLTARVGVVGYLARELLDEIPVVMVELST